MIFLQLMNDSNINSQSESILLYQAWDLKRQAYVHLE